MPDRSPDSLSPAEELFADWLARREDQGGGQDLEFLCREHPKEAGELRKLWIYWEGLRSVLDKAGFSGGPRSLAERIQDKFGSGVDPNVSIDAADKENLPSSALLKRLAEHTLKTSRYKLHGEIARGGMGAILKVFDEDLRRNLAMKVIIGKAEEAATGGTPPVDKRLLARFLEEAQITGQLDHPGIVPVHELGLDSDGRVFFTMKLVKGRDLKAIFDLVFEEQEGWNETRALGVILKVCEAMAYAHAKGVVHRDLKPANIMVGNFGEVYVMDWGLARVLGRADQHDLRLRTEGTNLTSLKTERREERSDAPDSPILTMDGDIVGTPAYMPPEQARGEVDRLSARSDVYAVGAMIYHLLARQMPYVPHGARVTNRSVLMMVLHGPPPALHTIRRDVPAELVAIAEKAMAREPERRYGDTLELAQDLRAYLEGRVVRAYEAGAWAETRKWVKRNRALASALALLMLGAVGMAAVQAAGRRAAEALRKTAEVNALAANAERERADAKTVEAERKSREARWQVYVTSLHAAAVAYRLGEWANLRRALDAAPEEYRGWEWGCLVAESDTSLHVLPHPGPVRDADFSPDGGRVVTASEGGPPRVWDTANGAQILELGSDVAGACAFSPDGTRVLTGATGFRGGGYLGPRVWDAGTGAQVALLARSDHVFPAFSQDGKRIISRTWEGEVVVWDATSGEELAVLTGAGDLRFAALSPDGTAVITADADSARVWDVSTAGEIGRLRPASEGIYFAAFSPDGTHIVTRGSSIHLWDAASLAHFVRLSEPPGGNLDLSRPAVFSSDGSTLASPSTDSNVGVWDVVSGRELCVLPAQVGRTSACSFSPDGRRVVTGSDDGTVRLWSTTAGTEPAVLRGHSTRVICAQFSSDGSRVLSGSDDGTARIWDSEYVPGNTVAHAYHGGPSVITATASSPATGRGLTAYLDDWIYVWDLESGTDIAVLRGHEDVVRRAAFSPDGGRVATGSHDRTARVWDTSSGSELAVIRGHARAVESVGVSPDGTRLCTVSADSVRLWDAIRGVEIASATLDGVDSGTIGYPGGLRHWFSTIYLAFSPDGRRIALSGTYRGRMLDSGTLAEIVSFPRLHYPGRIGHSPDGMRMVAGFADESGGTGGASWMVGPTARVFDALSGTELAVLRGHIEDVSCALFTLDGKRVVTTSGDGSLRIWDSVSGAELAVLGGSFDAATFHPDGARLFASSGGAFRVWDSVPHSVRFRESVPVAAEARARRAAADALAATAEPDEAIATIRAEPELDPDVRSAALYLLARRARACRAEAWSWVEAVHADASSSSEPERTIRTDLTRPEAVRRYALRIVERTEARETRADQARDLNHQAWELVAQPESASARELELALDLARRAVALKPSAGYIRNTLGVALYRAGRFEEALAALNQSSGEEPVDLAFRAMAAHQLGQNEKSADNLARLGRVMAEGRAGPEALGLLREAAALIMPQAVPVTPEGVSDE